MVLIRRTIPVLTCILLQIMFLSELHSQDSPFDPGMSRVASAIHEKVVILTDRSLYISGGQIQFQGRIIRQGLSEDQVWSTVLYVELVSPSGRVLEGGKYPISEGGFSGELTLPDRVRTGGYYLRCYTRWMKNWGPEHYSYAPVRIIHPFEENLEGDEGTAAGEDKLKFIAMGSAPVDFRSHPYIYDRGDSVHLILAAGSEVKQETLEGCLSVMPQLARPMPMMEVTCTSGSFPGDPFRVDFLPDLNGISLSGLVVKSGSGSTAVSDRNIHLTIFGTQSDYLVSRSDMYGRFQVSLPNRHGHMELFIQPEDRDGGKTEVRVDQDFDPKQLQLPVIPLQLSDSLLQMITVMARNMQLSRIYGTSDSTVSGMEPRPHVPFYGTPSFTLRLDDYVLLPTLEETFINLVPMVTPVKHRNHLSIHIHSENPAMDMYPPLLMIDQVPVFNMASFMTVSPDKISSIDVINDVYIKGGMRFGGVINLRSKERDMAGIKLPENAFFIDYESFRQPSPQVPEVHIVNRWPDTRNTILWIPGLNVGQEAPEVISFPAPEYPGVYTVLFRFITGGAEVSEAETSFIVR